MDDQDITQEFGEHGIKRLARRLVGVEINQAVKRVGSNECDILKVGAMDGPLAVSERGRTFTAALMYAMPTYPIAYRSSATCFARGNTSLS